ncbi:Pro-kumamolisin, activation domain-containing protein [Lactarius deliciosus]|nr:Pro-kumamolisin, activation domain-containing protein [Lactarius deliciosus]
MNSGGVHVRVKLGWGLIKGLAYLHEHKIAHRDIKPDNLVCDTIKVQDENTEVAEYRGTKGWTVPEMGEEDGPTPMHSPVKADRWSCGRVLRNHIMVGKGDKHLSKFAGQMMAKDPQQRPSLLEWDQWPALQLSDMDICARLDGTAAHAAGVENRLAIGLSAFQSPGLDQTSKACCIVALDVISLASSNNALQRAPCALRPLRRASFLVAKPLQPHWGSMRVKHVWNTVPPNWEYLGYPDAEATIDLQISLKSQHKNAGTDALYEISTPSHPKYRAYLSKEQVADLVALHPDTLEHINSWPGHHSVSSSMTSMTHDDSWLTVSGVPISQANDLLGASFELYRHSATNLTVLCTISYGLPAGLHAHVKSITPTTYFGSPRTLGQTQCMRSGRGELSGFPRILYEMGSYFPATENRNRLGVAGIIAEYPNPDDLKTFMSEFRLDGADNVTYEVVQIKDGGYDPSNPGLEANQNIQYTAALTTSGTHHEGDHFINWTSYLLTQKNIPQTVTTSYGVNKDDILPDVANSVCNLFKQLNMRGVSALGDDGVGKGNCKDTSGNVHFRPFLPASYPWVTTVRGTTGLSEQAASLSGGGLSNILLSAQTTRTKLFPSSGRQIAASPTSLHMRSTS